MNFGHFRHLGHFRHSSSHHSTALAAFVGFAVGALVMYLIDPVSGRRRRALAKDRAVATTHEAVDAIASKARDMRNRAQGLAHEAAGAASKVAAWPGIERRIPPRKTAASRQVA